MADSHLKDSGKPAPYPHLMSSLKVGAHTLKNRVIMGSLHTRIEHLDRSQEREVAFYAARARGGVGLIVTGGCAPSEEGLIEDGAHILATDAQLDYNRAITEAVHKEGAKILLQLIHAGRYAKHDKVVGVSDRLSSINRRQPRVLTDNEIELAIADFVSAAKLAQRSGYDGIEIMGSEGYLISQFTSVRTNNRPAPWGGSLAARCQFPVEIVRRIRGLLGPDFIIMYRISAADLMDEGMTADDITYLAAAVEQAGADILSTGVGWHEAPVPTISYQVPRGAWIFAVKRLKSAVSIPVVASNRINTPELAEELLASQSADLIALARPMLADPEFVNKAAAGKSDEINVCIACNQSCLDNLFSNQPVSCLVNPVAGRELEFKQNAPKKIKRLAVVGAGAAGLACAITAAERGHQVVLYEAAERIGGQLLLASAIPEKTEFNMLLAYYQRQIELKGVELHLNSKVNAEQLAGAGFDEIVIATGIKPRRPDLPGIDGPNVLTYLDVIAGKAAVGQRVAIVGAGGIAYDVAIYLAEESKTHDEVAFYREWGVDTSLAQGGLKSPEFLKTHRQITLFQRSNSRAGASLGVSTGWVLKSQIKRHGINVITGVTYQKIDEQGLHYSKDSIAKLAEVDTVIICAGQEPERGLQDALANLGVAAQVIGGAKLATELDAARAIDEGTRIAYDF